MIYQSFNNCKIYNPTQSKSMGKNNKKLMNYNQNISLKKHHNKDILLKTEAKGDDELYGESPKKKTQ